MTFDSSLLEFFEDSVTVEPFSSQTSAQAPTFGAAVTYRALIERGAKRVIDRSGREVISTIQVTIPERIHVDQRSRLTLPAGFVPQQPQIHAVTFLKGLGMDHTQISA